MKYVFVNSGDHVLLFRLDQAVNVHEMYHTSLQVSVLDGLKASGE